MSLLDDVRHLETQAVQDNTCMKGAKLDEKESRASAMQIFFLEHDFTCISLRSLLCKSDVVSGYNCCII